MITLAVYPSDNFETPTNHFLIQMNEDFFKRKDRKPNGTITRFELPISLCISIGDSLVFATEYAI